MKTQPSLQESTGLLVSSFPLVRMRWITALAAAWLAVQPMRAADVGVTFTRVTEGEIPNTPGSTWGCAWGDYDGDGYADLLVVNGFTDLGTYLYRNNRDGTFERVTTSPGNDTGSGQSCAWADYDNDGFLDLFVGVLVNPSSDRLYHNEGNDNAWLHVRPVGTVSNRSAIGAKVRILATIWGAPVWQMREIATGDGFTGQSDLRAHFGLGDATQVDTLRIEWPSGTVQELEDIPPNWILTVTEPPRLIPQSAGAFKIQCWINQSFDVEASTDLTSWSNVTTVTNLTGTLVFEDAEAARHESRYYRVVAK